MILISEKKQFSRYLVTYNAKDLANVTKKIDKNALRMKCFFCGVPGCRKPYKYVANRNNHEIKKHDYDLWT